MKEQVLNDVLARRFLLGQLSPEEQGRIEELAFQDPATFAFLQAAEEDLVDEFLYDELSPVEKERFQNHFLTRPGSRQNLRIARALKQYFAEDDPVAAPVVSPVVIPKPKPTFFQWLRLGALTAPIVIAAIVITTGVGVLVAVRMRRPPVEDPRHAQIQPSPVPTPSASPSASPVPSTASPSPPDNQNKRTPTPRQSLGPVYATLLPTSNPRSEGAVTTLKRSDPVHLELPVVNDRPYRSYQVLLLSEGQTVKRWNNLKRREHTSGPVIQISIPQSELASSQPYRVVLNGVSGNGETQFVHNYYFQISD